MDNSNRTIFVTGATGQQGGAVVRHLLKNGFKLKGLTRNPDRIEARSLKDKGVEVIQGNLDQPETIEKHLNNVYGIFSVQNFWEHGFQGEVKEGKALVDLAKKSNIQHFVYSSVGSAHKNTKLAHFDSKFEIENYLKQSKLPFTIFRPVFFMENFLAMHNQILEGRLVNAMEPNVPLHMIAVDDVGAFVAQAFLHPDIFLNKEIDIAGDVKTFPDVASILSDNLGEQVKYVKLDLNEFRNIMGDEYADMVDWFNRVGYNVDLDSLRENYDVDLTSFKDWVKKANFQQYKVKQHK